MYFKCLDSEGHWHWIADVIDIAKLEDADHIGGKVEVIGHKENAIHKAEPHTISLVTKHGPRLLQIYGPRAYLCNDETGATLDTVI